jgi:multimeric flavodoxin WrbA
MEEVLLIAGSPREHGNTAATAFQLRDKLGLNGEQSIDLCRYNIMPFGYDVDLFRDDFYAVITRMFAHSHIVFLTPVYWYAMSGLMKTFFDRFTDLLLSAEAKPLGRRLAERHVWLLANGTDAELPAGFTVPFERTAAYFSMHWEQASYVQIDGMRSPAEQDFSAVGALAAAIQRTRLS